MPQSQDGCRLLCVDDNEAAVSVRASVLRHRGFEVSTLSDATKVMDFLERHCVEGVILDYLMTQIRGDHLATMIRQRHPDIPIILISGLIDRPDDIGGADVFVSKSAGPRRLFEVAKVMRDRWLTSQRAA
jgi:CheY-like chemotaxis protein